MKSLNFRYTYLDDSWMDNKLIFTGSLDLNFLLISNKVTIFETLGVQPQLDTLDLDLQVGYYQSKTDYYINQKVVQIEIVP